MSSEDGTYYIQNKNITWPLYGTWNIDIITKSFLSAMKIEDFHWNLARNKPSWIPSLSSSKMGRFFLKLIYGK